MKRGISFISFALLQGLILTLFAQYDISAINGVLYVASVLPAFLYFSRLSSLSRNLFSLTLLVYFAASLVVPCAFRYIPDTVYFQVDNIEEGFQFCANVAVGAMAVFFLASSLAQRFMPVTARDFSSPPQKAFPMWVFPAFLLFAFGLTGVSQILGLYSMGSEDGFRELPFHLTGIIMILRMQMLPLLFMLLWVKQGRRLTFAGRVGVLLAWMTWGVFESVVMVSKSSVVRAFLPLLIYDFFSGGWRQRNRLWLYGGVMAVFLVGYGMIATMRLEMASAGGLGDRLKMLETERVMDSMQDDEGLPLVEPYNRIFMAGVHTILDMHFVSQNNLFDFSNAASIVKEGGSGMFTTFVIDQTTRGQHHRRGTTGLNDAMLFGGVGGGWIFILVMVFWAQAMDGGRLRRNPVLLVVVWLLFHTLLTIKSISFFLDAVRVGNITAYLALLWAARTYIRSGDERVSAEGEKT